MIQQSHSWVYIWRKWKLIKIDTLNVQSSIVYNTQDMEVT